MATAQVQRPTTQFFLNLLAFGEPIVYDLDDVVCCQNVDI
jgi:hypothetical protein